MDELHPLSGFVWKRGARLGLLWAALFFAMTGVVYALLSALGWEIVARAICAALAGPLLATALIAAWWIVRRPVFVAPGRAAGADREPGEGDREPDRRDDAPAL